MPRNTQKISPALKSLIKKSGAYNPRVSRNAQMEIAKAFEEPIREGVMNGDILNGLFTPVDFTDGQPLEYPLHWLAPGTEGEFVAYVIPGHGRIPRRRISADMVSLQSYEIGAQIDWPLKFAKFSRWDILQDAYDNMDDQFAKKINDDGFHTLIVAALDRNLIINDSDAPNGMFTRRLLTLLKSAVVRNGGGNTASRNRRRITDLYMSIEALGDVGEWNVDTIPESERERLYQSPDSDSMRILNVNLHGLAELGEGQEYQNFYTNELGGVLPPGDTEIVIGVNQTNERSFVMPVTEPVQVFPDDNMHRERLAGLYGWAGLGFAVLDNRDVVLASF